MGVQNAILQKRSSVIFVYIIKYICKEQIKRFIKTKNQKKTFKWFFYMPVFW